MLTNWFIWWLLKGFWFVYDVEIEDITGKKKRDLFWNKIDFVLVSMHYPKSGVLQAEFVFASLNKEGIRAK